MKNKPKQSVIYLVLLIFINCQAQIYSPGIGTYNQIRHTSCKKNKLGLCTGKLFQLQCENFYEVVSDPNNVFSNKSDVSIIANLDCKEKDYFVFEELEKFAESRYDFFRDREKSSKTISYKYNYIKFTYQNTGETFEFPKEPNIAYIENKKNSASQVSYSEKNSTRYLIVFEKKKSASSHIKILSNEELLYVY
jgi:hypothetical protein